MIYAVCHSLERIWLCPCRAYYRGCGDPHSAQEIMREVAVWGGFRPSRKAQHHLQMLWQQVEQINGL